MKILLVGGGITSAVTGTLLRRILPDSNIVLWDKARGAGGRMTSSRCSLNPKCIADLGAQYITTTDDFIKSNDDVYRELISEGIIEPLTCQIIGLKPQGNKKNFVVANGTGFLVKRFIERANLNATKFLYHVSSIIREDGKWIVETKTGEKEDFDLVILTMPVPQLFLLEGTIKSELNADLVNKLESVQYSARYALVLFFLENLKENWGAQYFDDNPVFRYVSIENIKRNQPDNLSAVVFHTSVSFGIKHVEDPIPDIEKVLLSQAKIIFPNWPEPKAVKCHKWRFSQVVNPYPDTPGCLVVSTSPPLLIGGDGFVGSTFDNCVKSSRAICDSVKQILQMT